MWKHALLAALLGLGSLAHANEASFAGRGYRYGCNTVMDTVMGNRAYKVGMPRISVKDEILTVQFIHGIYSCQDKDDRIGYRITPANPADKIMFENTNTWDVDFYFAPLHESGAGWTAVNIPLARILPDRVLADFRAGGKVARTMLVHYANYLPGGNPANLTSYKRSGGYYSFYFELEGGKPLTASLTRP